MKKIFALTLVMCLVLSFSGCGKEGKECLSAAQKLAAAESFCSNSKLSATFSYSIPENEGDDFLYLPSVLNMLENLSVFNDVEYKDGESVISGKLATGTSDFGFSGYTKTVGNSTEVYCTIPTIFRAFLPKGHENATMVKYDTFEDNYSLANMFLIPINAVMPFCRGMSPRFASEYYTFLEHYGEFLDSTKNIVTYENNTYTLSLSDESAQKVLRDILYTYIENEEAQKEVKTFIEAVLNSHEGVYPDEEIQKIREEILKNIDVTNTEESKKEADKFINDITKNSSLGDDGLKFKLTVDDNGYPIHQSIVMDIVFDMDYSGCYDEPYNVRAKITSETDYSNINNVKELKRPDFSGENLILLSEWIDKPEDPDEDGEYIDESYIDNVKLPAEDGSIKVFLYSHLLDFNGAEPFLENEFLYVPASFFERIGFCPEVQENELYVYRKWKPMDGISFYDGSTVCTGPGHNITLKAPVIVRDGVYYVPLRSVASVYGYNVTWDAERNCVLMH